MLVIFCWDNAAVNNYFVDFFLLNTTATNTMYTLSPGKTLPINTLMDFYSGKTTLLNTLVDYYSGKPTLLTCFFVKDFENNTFFDSHWVKIIQKRFPLDNLHGAPPHVNASVDLLSPNMNSLNSLLHLKVCVTH